MAQLERTLTMIKPDAVRNGHLGVIIDRITDAGFKIIALKMTQLSRRDAGLFYAEHKGKPFFDELVAYMVSGPFIGILFVNMNCMQSTGDALPATILSVLRQGLLLIPLLYLLNAVFGLNGVIYGQALTDCVAIVLSMYIWGRKKRKLKSE